MTTDGTSATPVVEIDYTTYTADQLLAAIGEAWAKKDMKLMAVLAKLHTKAEAAAEAAKRAEIQTKLAGLTAEVQAAFDKVATRLRDSGKYDGADGFWYAMDFGEKLTTCRITKAAKAAKASGEAGTAGKSSYVANPAKSSDLLAQVGGHVMFAEAATVTIDKVEQTVPAGMTFQQAYDHSQNGGWRNRVRMALLKEAGII